MANQKTNSKKPSTQNKSKKSFLKSGRKFDPRVAILVALVIIVSVGYLLVRLGLAYRDDVTSTNSAAKNPAPVADNKAVKAVTINDNFIDISSPQCDVLHKIGKREFGIVGLNGTYMAFGRNPCLIEELALFRSYDLYVGANYPSKNCPSSMSPYDCGVLAGTFNNDLIRFLKLKPGKIWIDAEVGPRIPWSTQANNRAYLQGLKASLLKSVKTVGYYSNQSAWNEITGGMSTGSANWYAIGPNTAAGARAACKAKTFGQAPNVYIQYIEGGLDHNVLCK